MSAERKVQIDLLLDKMVSPDTPLEDYYRMLHERAVLIREEAGEFGTPVYDEDE